MRRWLTGLALAGGLVLPSIATAQTLGGGRVASRLPDGAELVRLLGPRAAATLAPSRAPGIGALVRLPPGMHGADVGLPEAAPGIARLFGAPADLLAFADAHADLPIEVAPPLHLLLDSAGVYVGAGTAIAAGMDGTGAVVGVADTGLDVTLPDFRDAQGNTRVRWLLDLSSPPRGVHPDLEQKFGTPDSSGAIQFGAVWSADDIDAALKAGSLKGLTASQAANVAGLLDSVGHGTLVTSCAAGNKTPYRGVAPGADIVFAAITQAGDDSIANDDLLRGVAFLFDRGDSLGEPVVANLSIGSDFGPHDGTTAWEQTLASNVGADKPGHALVVAAGNSGSIVETPVHENVHVSSGSTMRVPILTEGAANGAVEVWVAVHGSANLRVGLDASDGSTWIEPVDPNSSGGKTTDAYSAGVLNGNTTGSPVPAQSHGAAVVWAGAWPGGTYYVTLVGSGTADLYLEAGGDAVAGFTYAVREGTINLPATSPSIIGVGCTINKSSWESIDSPAVNPLPVPLLDAVGGSPDPTRGARAAVGGEPCWFSSGGPSLTGLNKPEILAPGAAIVGALSGAATPPAQTSIFTTPDCPSHAAGGAPDPKCQQIDSGHAISFGTSFSSPLVAGAVAALFQRDPTLTQGDVVAALQGGAHPVRARGPSYFADQASVGELDVPGALAAVDRRRAPQAVTPVRSSSWLALGADGYFADGTTPLQAILELRAPAAPSAGSLGAVTVAAADAFGDGRLVAYAKIDGRDYGRWACSQEATPATVPGCARRGPGVWVITLQPPAGFGGSSLTLGATFDGADVVDPQSLPIATDTWSGEYPPAVSGGGCAAGGASGETPGRAGALALALAAVTMGASRSRSRARPGPRRPPRRRP